MIWMTMRAIGMMMPVSRSKRNANEFNVAPLSNTFASFCSENEDDTEKNGTVDDEDQDSDDGSISLGGSDDDISVFDGDEDDDEDIFEESDPEDEPKSKKLKAMSGKDFQKQLKNTDSE